MKYRLKNGEFEVHMATVQQKASGNPYGHLSAYPGDYIIQFPFDAGEKFAGIPFSIPIPGHLFAEHFEPVPEKKSASKKTAKKED